MLVAVLGALLAAAGARPAAAGPPTPSATLTLSAPQGQAAATLTMTYHYVVNGSCPGGTVTFYWDTTARAVARADLSPTDCTASVPALPPAGANAPGAHTVIGQLNAVAATVTYLILAPPPAPTPAPTPRPTVTTTPTSTPTTTPTPDPPPTATPTAGPCNTKVPQATSSGGYLQVAGLTGDVTEPQHAGTIQLTSTSPSTMLPPALGTVPLTNVTLAKRVDGSSQALVQAVARGTRFDCVHVEMGPAGQYLYVTYAFHDAQFAGYGPSGSQQLIEELTLSYVTVDWEYQMRDGTAVATGSGRLGSTPNPHDLRPAGIAQGPMLLVLGLLLVGGGGGGAFWLRRRARQRRP